LELKKTELEAEVEAGRSQETRYLFLQAKAT